MLIGNGDYKKFDVNEKIQKCPRCPSPENYCNLHLKESLVRLKKKLESFGYLVIAFLDLKEEEFLRVKSIVHEMLLKATPKESVTDAVQKRYEDPT